MNELLCKVVAGVNLLYLVPEGVKLLILKTKRI